MRNTHISTLLLLFLFTIFFRQASYAAIYHVAQKHPQAADENPGTQAFPFKTISQAAEILQPGDEVIVHEGIYRERVAPPRGGTEGNMITYRAADNERVVIKGSEVWNPVWKEIAPQVYEGVLDPVVIKNYNPYAIRIVISPPQSKDTLNMVVRPAPGPKLERTLGQIFVDGILQNEMESVDELLETPRSFLVSGDGKSILVHFDDNRPPQERLVEITVRERIFAPHKRGLGYIRVKGFTMEHAANQGPFPQIGAVSPRSGHHWIFENNVIRYAKTVGIDIGSECWGKGYDDGNVSKYHLIQNNTICDNGLVGITGLNSEKVIIRRNVVERNNSQGFDARFDVIWWEQGGMKFHKLTDGIIEDNLVRDNDAFGIWIDNGDEGARVTRNLILNNLFAGIFIELGIGPCTVDNNVVAFTRSGEGIYTHDGINIRIFHNLCYFNSTYGIWSWNASNRKGVYDDGLVRTDSVEILNNICLGNAQGAISLPIPYSRAHNNRSDYNFFWDGAHWFSGQEPNFKYNVSNGLLPETPVYIMKQAIERGLLPENARPNVALWKVHQQMNLTMWQTITANDLHSIAAPFKRSIIRARDCEFESEVPAELFQVKCKRIREIDVDYFGNTIARNPIPGPFQNLKTGHQKLYLWPKMEK